MTLAELLPESVNWPGFEANVAFLRNANPNRNAQCDGCVECCVQPPILPDDLTPPQFWKPPGVPCRFLSPIPGQGCSIYDQRPVCCRSYRCWAVYLLREGRLEDYRRICRELERDGQRTVTTKAT